MEELILIARIRRPHGIKGELLVESFTHDEKRFKSLNRLFLRSKKGDVREVTLASFRPTHQGVLITLAEIPDRTAAETLNGSELLIPISERPKLRKGQVYFDEIVGMSVVDDQSGAQIGNVTEILEMPAGDVVVFERLDGEEHLITMRGEEIKKIDTAKKELRVSLLEELNERSSKPTLTTGENSPEEGPSKKRRIKASKQGRPKTSQQPDVSP